MTVNAYAGGGPRRHRCSGPPRIRIPILLLLAVLATGCGDTRTRPPLDPVDDPARESAEITIVRPTEGEEVPRLEFTTPPGFRVSLNGHNLRDGDELLLLVFTDQSPNSAVFAAEARVERGQVPDSARILLSDLSLEGVSEAEILIHAFEGVAGGGRRTFSSDSVGVIVR